MFEYIIHKQKNLLWDCIVHQRNASSQVDLVLSKEFYARLADFIDIHRIARKRFCREDLEIVTLSMKVTLFQNLY